MSVDIVGFEKIIPVKYIKELNEITDYIVLTEEGHINLYINNAEIGRLDVNKVIFGMSNHPDGSNIVESNLGGYKIKIIVESASGEKTVDKITVTSLQAIVLIKQVQAGQ